MLIIFFVYQQIDVLDDFNEPKKPAVAKPSAETPLSAEGVDEEEIMKLLEAEMMANLLCSDEGSQGKEPTGTTAAAAGGGGAKDIPNIPKNLSETFDKELQKRGISMESLIKGLGGAEEAGAGKNEAATSSAAAEASTESDAISEEAIIKLMMKSMENSKGEYDMKGVEDLLKDIHNKEAAAAAGGTEGGNFQDTIQRTLERMQESGDKATAAAASTDSDGLSEEMMGKILMNLLNENGEGNMDELEDMFKGVIKDISNKEMLYEPMKDYHAKYGPFLEANKDKLPPEDLARYETQARIVTEIVEKFDEEGYSDSDPECLAFIWDHMQQVFIFYPPLH